MEISDTEESISISQEARYKAGRNFEKQYYSTPGCEGLLQQLLHLLRFGEGLPVVQAGRSAGKTAMSNALCNRLDECSWLAQVQCDQDQDLAELLEQIVHGFGLQADFGSGTGAGESLAALRHFSTQLANNRELAVLILDDAHLLDNQGLGAVLSLLQGNNLPGYGLHMVFFCAPGLVERIDGIGLLDAPVYDFEIPLFSPSELSGFLKSRFPPETSSKLSAGLVQNIWSQSMGSPGMALHIVSKSDLASQDQGDLSRSLGFLNSMPKGHLIALFVLVAVLLWAAFARESLVPSGNDAPLVIERLPAKTESTVKIESEIKEEPAATVATLPLEEVNNNTSDEIISDAINSAKSGVGMTDEEGGGLADIKELEKAVLAPDQEAVQRAPDAQATSQQIPKLQIPEQQVTKQAPEQSQAPAQAPAKQEAVSRRSPVRPLGMSAQELFLMDQAPDIYTLQIIAASRKDALQKYISAQANKSDLYLYQGLREGRAWFVVVTGIFTTRQEALQAVNDLPQEQKNGGPWPRQLSSIQSEIAANRSR